MAEICDHNEQVARRVGKLNVAMLWQFVKIIYSSLPKQYPNADPFRNPAASQNHLLANRMLMATPNSIAQHWTDEKSDDKASLANESNNDEYKTNDFQMPKLSDFNKMTINQNGSEEGTVDALNNIVYGDNELTVEHMDRIKSLRNGFLYIGPHDLTKNFSWPSDSMMNHDMQQTTRNQTMSRNRLDTSPVIFNFDFICR